MDLRAGRTYAHVGNCAFADCGRPDCAVCAWARTPSQATSMTDAMRPRALAVPKAVKEKPIWMPKRRYRVGPHR